MPDLVMLHDCVLPSGKTIKEENLERHHNIPVGTLVEVKYDAWHGGGACEKVHARLWVALHQRDCDGTPLYCLSHYNLEPSEIGWARTRGLLRRGFSEEALTPVEHRLVAS